MKYKIILAVFLLSLFSSTVASADDQTPMLKDYINEWDYGTDGKFLQGYIPALDENVLRPWQLSRWTAIFNFSGDSTTSRINNYDVFNVKKNIGDPDFDKENGFGLVYKSPDALGELFDAIMNGQSVTSKQRAYFREAFIKNADDEDFLPGHPYFYQVELNELLRIPGIVQRMGISFKETKKISESNRQAIYEVTKWPEIKAKANNGKLKVDIQTYGVADRDVRIVATSKGAFPNLKNVVSLNEGRLIHTSDPVQSASLIIDDYESLAEALGRDIDVIVDDGYGRTAIQTVHLPEMPKEMDYIPTKLTLTEGRQLWLKWKYVGEDFNAGDYIDGRGIPDIATVKVSGPENSQQTFQEMFSGLPETMKNGQEFNHYLGKVEVGRTPGKYKIKVNAFVNNPNHQSRALEVPVEAYKNNEIEDEFEVELQEIDLVALSITASPSRIKRGDSSNITAKVINRSQEDQKQVLIRISAGKDTIYEVKKDMPANKEISVGPVKWTGREIGLHNITIHVDPEAVVPDVNEGNNIASTGCMVSSGETTSDSSCSNNKSTANVTSKWTVTYPYIVRILPISRPVWEYEDVLYHETLSVSTEINTRQGIATDKNNPKESDRHSRGSWAIIPYAKEKGLNPNEVTRAGYGYELKVTTNYYTNWEKLVPKGLKGTAEKIGGTYSGPKPGEVIAKFYDRKGNYIETVTLERTSGGNTGAATWELPIKEHTMITGETYRDRKIFTDKDWSDGDVTVKVYVRAEDSYGDIYACTTSKVRIFGSMFEDSQNVRQRY
ncbi:CARDB domain-containing protein [Paenibacillus enshidis]|uniref:CARDB domain-containing protein n=1 Tax=Paenibacillus enshidis TaxID=1458439 RepID=A0ABV5AVA5_9BACL